MQKATKFRRSISLFYVMLGQKRKLSVVEKSKIPHYFRGVKKLPVYYYVNKSAWMTRIIFNEWLLKWDNELKHDILLLLESCNAYDLNVSPKHINVVVLTPSTTSLIQPYNQGIINAFKAYYLNEMCVSFRRIRE